MEYDNEGYHNETMLIRLNFFNPSHFLLNWCRGVLNDFYMHKTFSLQKYFCIEACSRERIPFHVTPSSVLTLNVMETCMHVLKYYKKQNTLKNEAILM